MSLYKALDTGKAFDTGKNFDAANARASIEEKSQVPDKKSSESPELQLLKSDKFQKNFSTLHNELKELETSMKDDQRWKESIPYDPAYDPLIKEIYSIFSDVSSRFKEIRDSTNEKELKLNIAIAANLIKLKKDELKKLKEKNLILVEGSNSADVKEAAPCFDKLIDIALSLLSLGLSRLLKLIKFSPKGFRAAFEGVSSRVSAIKGLIEGDKSNLYKLLYELAKYIVALVGAAVALIAAVIGGGVAATIAFAATILLLVIGLADLLHCFYKNNIEPWIIELRQRIIKLRQRTIELIQWIIKLRHIKRLVEEFYHALGLPIPY